MYNVFLIRIKSASGILIVISCLTFEVRLSLRESKKPRGVPCAGCAVSRL